MANTLSQDEAQRRVHESFIQNVDLISKYTGKRNNVTLKCNECGYEWTTKAQNVLYSDKDFPRHQCPNCKSNNAKNGQTFNCAYCGKEIYRTAKDIKENKSGFFYCCREHGNIHKNILRQQNGEWDESSNYRLKAFMTYEHKCACCGWCEDERILEVHHIDENRQHNNVENLMILCPICHRKITLGYYRLEGISLIEVEQQVQVLLLNHKF